MEGSRLTYKVAIVVAVHSLMEGSQLLVVVCFAPKAHHIHRDTILLQLLGNLDKGFLRAGVGQSVNSA
eukprot:1158408-Pelagomonas_calceolata.AAC.3